jgi:DNA-binding CsgD family transcriptional regulator
VGRHLSNLPAEVTSFVGRRQELREVKRLLTTTRLLTLTGSGGVGKTKLALRAAADMSRGFPDGAWLVLLGSIRDPLLVTQAVLSALGVQDLSAGLSLSSLTEYLAGKRMLVVLDNCEHLLDACAVLAGTLLASCPDLQVLATSRQALGVAGEVRMVVPPMSLPGEGQQTSVQQLLGCDAVWLLSERAVAVVPGFAVGSANAEQVLALCRRLDGIPLALELAAVRLGSLTLKQLNQGLAGELSILGRAFARGRAMTIDEGVAFAAAGTARPEPPACVTRTEPHAVLTGRQLEIARLVADDLTNRQIADRLFLSERTVETHITNILNKLGLGSRIQISRWVTESAPAAATPAPQA